MSTIRKDADTLAINIHNFVQLVDKVSFHFMSTGVWCHNYLEAVLKIL